MKVIIGKYLFLTKYHFLRIKDYFKHIYIRDDFDTLIIDTEFGKLKITQDGLICIHSDMDLKQIYKAETWFKNKIIKKIFTIIEEDPSIARIFLETKPTIILNDVKNIDKAYEELKRDKDYEYKAKRIKKYYGDNLIIFNNNRFPKKYHNELMEYQIILADYQSTIINLLDRCIDIGVEVREIKKKESIQFKEIPEIINHLIYKRKETKILLKKLSQFDDFLNHRNNKCRIANILDELKLHDFKEMIQMNSYASDQYDLTSQQISSVMELTEFYYKENEQKELTILQVIFSIGTIAALISLGAMPGAEFIGSISNGKIVGDIINFRTPALFQWGILSLICGVILFFLLNFVFFNLKRIRTVSLFKQLNKPNEK